ncbi:MAG TPA: cobalamin-dependent protein, partial [Roseiflexaceae bacterium]|nr:cobalamin-dependent protein [Roseiflexaceae bacterium]
MRQLAVLLMQLPVPNNSATNVPLAAGYLKAYAHAQGLLDDVAIDILPRALADHAGDAMLVEAIVARAPDVLGISLYTWNSERSLGIAQRAKARLPNLIVVVGGPEVQRDNAWVLQHPAVDMAVLGEGEQTFAELLRIWTSRQADKQTGARKPFIPLSPLVSVPGIAFRDQGELVFTPDRVALNDLSALSSPYLLGFLEPGNMLMVEVSRWCPYACSFCLYGRNMGPKLGSRYFPL